MNGDTPSRPDNAAHQDERVKVLVEQVDEGYGQALVEQLIQRLEQTVREFEVEVTQLLERLHHNAATQEELLDRIKQQSEPSTRAGDADRAGLEEEIPEWERRLAELEGPSD